MQSELVSTFLIFGVSLVLGVAMTLLIRSVAWRLDFVAKPRSDRWAKRPTAMLGGVAIFATSLIVYFVFVPITQESLVLVGGSTVLFFVGLIDDVLNIRPYQKLIGQLVGAIVVVGFGLTLPITGYQVVDVWITIFWLVGITNAINLLDNMDGLAVGIALIAAVSLGISFYVNGQYSELRLIAAYIGALSGFLVFNLNPASIFMGDSGSMFVGFFLAGSVLLNQVGGRSRGMLPILAVPVLILFVPIFDTTLVTVIRKMKGRRATQGGRDHTSHRLVALGLSEKRAVFMLYGFAIIAGSASLVVKYLQLTESLALLAAFSIFLVIIGVFLSRVRVYDAQQEDLAKKENAAFAFLVNVSYKRRIFEVLLDVFLISLSYYASYLLVFGSFEESSNWEIFVNSLPILILVKIAAFLIVGVYRGLWRYTSIVDLVTFAKGVILGSVVSVLALLLMYRFNNFSRAVFVVDGLLLFASLAVTRMAFRLIRMAIPSTSVSEGRNVLIYGAGDGGEMLLRELRNNPAWGLVPTGFVDDDPAKINLIINGLKVYESNGKLANICKENEISDILLSMRQLDPDRLIELRELCRDANISLQQAQIRIEPVEFE